MESYILRLPCFHPKILSWTILFFAALNVVFLGGKRRAFGGFVAVLHKEFTNVTLTELNWIGDSYAAIGYMTTGLSTAMILHFDRRYGFFQFLGSVFILLSCVTSSAAPNPHWLFLTHTVFHGIGSSLVISTVGLVVNEHFNKKHPYHLLATTLVSGGSVASIVFVTFFAYLIEEYDWRIAFVILGAIYFIVNTSAVIFFKKNDALTEQSDKTLIKCSCDGIKMKQVPLLVLWFVDRVLTSVVTYGLLLNLTDYLHRTGATLVSSTIMTTLFAAGEASTYLIGAVITAATKSFFKNKLGYILLVTSLVMSISLVIMEFVIQHVSARRALCFIAGFALGPSITFLFPAGEELTRLPGQMAYPFSLGGMGVGMMISPLLTAKIAEIFAYKWFFLVQGCFIFVKFLCLSMIMILLFYYKRCPAKNDDTDLEWTDDEEEGESLTPDETTELIPEDEKKSS